MWLCCIFFYRYILNQSQMRLTYSSDHVWSYVVMRMRRIAVLYWTLLPSMSKNTNKTSGFETAERKEYPPPPLFQGVSTHPKDMCHLNQSFQVIYTGQEQGIKAWSRYLETWSLWLNLYQKDVENPWTPMVSPFWKMIYFIYIYIHIERERVDFRAVVQKTTLHQPISPNGCALHR